jgi:hypothetical protein
MMQFAHSSLKGVKGQDFYKLMGTGKGIGFNPLPDWSVYCLLQVWDHLKDAQEFFDHSSLMERYQSHCSERITIYMRNITAHGQWNGRNPFIPAVSSLDNDNPLIAVITRARIRTSRLLKFWSYVPTSEKPLKNCDGLLFTKGVGEAPVVNMATFSIWTSMEELKAFAYASEEHKKAIQMTRDLGWYSEELFSRFQPFRTQGSWSGLDIQMYLKTSDEPQT